MSEFLERCDRACERGWGRVHDGPFFRHLREHGLDRALYVRLMTEIWHYTRHNAQNQALAAVRVDSSRLPLLRFCLQHAREEAGHDLMVLGDLEAVGVPRAAVLAQRPLPETEGFVAYVYRVAAERDATARLGYSYWAESCYPYIDGLLVAMRRDLGLADRDMTFFVAHAEVDVDHFREVREVAERFCDTPERREAMLTVLEDTLALTGRMLDAVHVAWSEASEPAVAVR